MRLALLVFLLVGCAKKSADAPAASAPAAEPTVGGAGATTGSAPLIQSPTADEKQRESNAAAPPPKGGGAAQGAQSGSAIDEARASGVLGPTDPHAFAIKSNVSIKRASTKQLDAAAKTNLDAVKACYDKALEYKDTLVGELTVSVNAGKATVAKTTLKNPELEKCVVEALTALPASGKATLVLAFKRE